MIVSRLHSLFLVAASVCLLVACGEDKERPTFDPNNISESDMSETEDLSGPEDLGDTDAGDTDMGGANLCGDEGCMQGLKCVRGDCVPESAQLACDEVEDLGELAADGSAMASGDTSNFVDTQDASCVEVVDGFSGPENAFKFTVADRALVTVELTSLSTNLTWGFSVNRGTCLNGSEVVCTIAESTQFVAEPGEEYFIVVQPDAGVDTGQFELALNLQPRECAVPGERTCMGDTIQICGQMGTLECSGGCTGGRCDGESCDNPIEITAAMTLNGAARAHVDDYNFADRASCGSIDTPGQDFVLSFPGLTAGQTIVVDASQNDDLDHAIFVSDNCNATAECLASIDLGDRLEYVVENDGDHFVIVDKLSGSTGDYQVSVDIQ